MKDGSSELLNFPRLIRVLAVVILLGAYALIALYSIQNKAATADEGIHLTGGLSYWKFNDYRMQPENGNLPQRWAAIPLLFQPLNMFTGQHSFWQSGNVWEMERVFLYKIGNQPVWMLFTARAMMVLAATLIGFLLFCYARSLWGYGCGLVCLFLYCFSPDVLAHGRLLTSDIIGAGAFILAAWSLHTLLKRIDLARIGFAGLSFGLLAVAKYSAVLMVPITAVCIIAHLLLNRSTILYFRQSRYLLSGRLKRLISILSAFFVVGLIAWTVLWSFYGFRYSAFNDSNSQSGFLKSWEGVKPESSLISNSVDFARAYRLLPEAYLYGFSHVIKYSENRHAFLAGGYSSTGWWYFFPFTFLVKSPMALFALLILAIILCGIQLRDSKRSGLLGSLDELPEWLVPTVLILVYGGAAVSTTLNIGHRHILPIYLALFILIGGVWRWIGCRGVPSRALLSVFLFAYAYESLRVYPNFLAFFNRLSGGPEAGHLLLVDSSLDWGQDLYALDDWLREHNSGTNREIVTLSYFGRSSPKYLGMDARYLLSRGTFKRDAYTIAALEPGLYAMSATMLQGMYSPDLRPWTAQHESTYRFLLSEFRRLVALAPDQAAMLQLIEEEGATKWANCINHFISYRAERLRIRLLNMEPEEVINHTIFIYRLSEEDLQRIVIDPSVGFPDGFPTHEFSRKHSKLFE